MLEWLMRKIPHHPLDGFMYPIQCVEGWEYRVSATVPCSVLQAGSAHDSFLMRRCHREDSSWYMTTPKESQHHGVTNRVRTYGQL